MMPRIFGQKRKPRQLPRGVDVCKVCTCQPRYQVGYMHLIPRLVNHNVGAERCPDDYNRVKQKPAGGWVGWGVIGLIFAGYVPLASQSPHPIIVYSVANYRPHLSYF